ncbi:MAG: phytoene desaturase family protein [Chitinophagales bacterium]|nr:phytoene desaturase family protein [Chitinophagales bacterium]MDW8427652.1 phytoene desaturase family protein [Chitinophagales bacterium]
MKALVVGTGLGGLATALQLAHQGWEVEMVEKHSTAGGRLNRLERNGFVFDVGPSFFSMSYEFRSFFEKLELPLPFSIEPLDPLYAVFFDHRPEPLLIWRDRNKLTNSFAAIEPDFSRKLNDFLHTSRQIFEDTEWRIVKRNFDSIADYLKALSSVPLKHLPKLLCSMWTHLERHFESEEAKAVFSLVSFFLGAPPFRTPAVYALLNYVELQHDGYWNVRGGMYRIVEAMVDLLQQKGVALHFDREIVAAEAHNGRLQALVDHQGHRWSADVFVINGDAAAFRGLVFKRHRYRQQTLDRMQWTLAPFTMYLGVRGRIQVLQQHNYFLGTDFRNYAKRLFQNRQLPAQPYYYVNVSSKNNPDCAPPNCENLFVLCPVPDLRYKSDWSDAQQFADLILDDLSRRCDFPIRKQLLTCTVYTPKDWEQQFNLYRGSGLGLGHGLMQVGALRPANYDEQLKNVFYVGASTVPGTGLPMVLISSQLVLQRIESYARSL